MADDQLPDPFGKALRRGAPDLETKAAQNAAQAHLNVVKPRLHQLARGEQRADLLRLGRFAMHRTEPPKPHQLRNPARVIAVRLHRHRRQRRLHVPRLQQFDRKPHLPQRRIKPLRQWPGLQPDPLQPQSQRAEPGDQCLRLTRHLRLPSDLAGPVDNTHARAFQRHVNSGIIVHGRPSMMLGADLSDSVDTISSEGRPPNIRKAASERATP